MYIDVHIYRRWGQRRSGNATARASGNHKLPPVHMGNSTSRGRWMGGRKSSREKNELPQMKPKAESPNPKSYPKSKTRKPKPETRSPKPEARSRNPKPKTRSG